MSGALGDEWEAVFREPIDPERVSAVLSLLGAERWLWTWTSLTLSQASNFGDDAVGDLFEGLARNEPGEPHGLGLTGAFNAVFRRLDVDQGVDREAQVLVVQALQLVRKQDHQNMLMSRQYAGDLGVGFHSCGLSPELVALVARGPFHSDRNLRSIFSTRSEGHTARTAFAAQLKAMEAFEAATLRSAVVMATFAASIRLPWWARLHQAVYRALEKAGDQVGAFGARFSRGRS